MRCEPMAGIKVFSFFSYSHTNWLSKTSIYSSGPIVLDQVFAEIFAAGFPLFIIMIHQPAYFSGKYADSFDWQFFKIIKASSESLQSMLNWFEYWSHHFEIPSAILWLNAVYYIVLKYFQNLMFPYQRFSCSEWMNEDNILMKAFWRSERIIEWVPHISSSQWASKESIATREWLFWTFHPSLIKQNRCVGVRI